MSPTVPPRLVSITGPCISRHCHVKLVSRYKQFWHYFVTRVIPISQASFSMILHPFENCGCVLSNECKIVDKIPGKDRSFRLKKTRGDLEKLYAAISRPAHRLKYCHEYTSTRGRGCCFPHEIYRISDWYRWIQHGHPDLVRPNIQHFQFQQKSDEPHHQYSIRIVLQDDRSTITAYLNHRIEKWLFFPFLSETNFQNVYFLLFRISTIFFLCWTSLVFFSMILLYNMFSRFLLFLDMFFMKNSKISFFYKNKKTLFYDFIQDFIWMEVTTTFCARSQAAPQSQSQQPKHPMQHVRDAALL